MDVNEVLEFVYTLASINSSEKTDYLAKYIMGKLRELGIKEVKEERVLGKSVNLIVNPIKTPKLAIVTHLDTIPHMIRPSIINDYTVKGTGVVDAKGSIASMIYALSKIRELDDDVSFVFVSGEEVDSAGVLKYLENHRPEKALVMEPSKLNLHFGSVGYVEVKVQIEGKRRHPDFIFTSNRMLENSPPEKFIKWYENLKRECRNINCNVIILNLSTDGSIFSTPSLLVAELNILLKKEATVDQVIKTLNKLEDENITTIIEDASDPFKTDDSTYIEILSEVYMEHFNRPPLNELYPAWTDATIFHEHKVPVAIFGPGDYTLAHSGDEKIDVREVMEAGEFLVRLIGRFTG